MSDFAELPTPSRFTAVDLFAFGNRQGPRAPRSGSDVHPDSDSQLPSSEPPYPDGASIFADPERCPLTGNYWRLAAATELPRGLLVLADGLDVDPRSERGPTHHTIYPAEPMSFTRFKELLLVCLQWHWAGKKRP